VLDLCILIRALLLSRVSAPSPPAATGGMASLDLPYRCPRCGEHKRFRSLSSLRAHLEYNHTYETLYVLSKSNSVCDAAALLPLVAEGALLAPVNNNDPFEPLRPSALKERRFPCRELPCADDLSLTPANSNTAARYIPNVEFPHGEIFMKKAMTSADQGPHGNPSTAVAVAANVAASAVEAAYEEGLARLKARAFERLELDERLEKLSEEVNTILLVVRINLTLTLSRFQYTFVKRRTNLHDTDSDIRLNKDNKLNKQANKNM